MPAIILASLASCDVDRDAAQILISEARDSAGVAIVENTRPAPGSRLGWRVGEAPDVSIGTGEGDEGEMLFTVLDATKLADGRIVLANAGTSELRVFGADGTYLETWGGQGEGPGEFSAYTPQTVSRWLGDSIAADNMFARRLEIFDSRGNHGRTVTLADGFHSFLGDLPDGAVLAKPSAVLSGVFGSENPLLRRDQEFGLLLPDGELRVSLGAHPGEEWFSSPAGPMAMPHPFGRSTIATIWGGFAVVAPTDRYELRAYRSDGTLVRIIRREHEPRSPTQAELDTVLAEAYADLPDARRTRLLAETEDMPLVEFFPAFEALHSDPLGYLWVQEYRLPGAPQVVWTVFEPEGRVQGFAETPRGLDVFEIGEDYVLGKTIDEFDVERVQLWRLDRAP
ncbi:MAG: hypothetical protein OXE73_13715 [Gammaproteobacteria bacterium]|nr:hypothetical protein [Gammaproteobacteria bacterium]